MPKPKPYRLHPEAWLEFEAADDWYLTRSLDASLAFLSDVYSALEDISKAPRRWPKHLHGTRRFVFHRFPFSIIYLDDPDFLTIKMREKGGAPGVAIFRQTVGRVPFLHVLSDVA